MTSVHGHAPDNTMSSIFKSAGVCSVVVGLAILIGGIQFQFSFLAFGVAGLFVALSRHVRRSMAYTVRVQVLSGNELRIKTSNHDFAVTLFETFNEVFDEAVKPMPRSLHYVVDVGSGVVGHLDDHELELDEPQSQPEPKAPGLRATHWASGGGREAYHVD